MPSNNPRLSFAPGDCLTVMQDMIDAGTHLDSIVTGPPDFLGLLGCAWDRTGVANRVETWRLARVRTNSRASAGTQSITDAP